MKDLLESLGMVFPDLPQSTTHNTTVAQDDVPELMQFIRNVYAGVGHAQRPATRPIPKPPKFRSIRRAEFWCRKHFGLCGRCNLQGGDLNAINPTITQLAILSNEFPEVADRFVQFTMDKREESFVAAVEFARRGLLLNPEYYSDARRLELDIFQNMWIGASPDNCTEIEYVATHEFAHEIEIWITSQKTVVDLNGDIGELNVVFDKWLLSQNLNNALSLRGKENYTEYFAEAFASHYHTEKPSQIAEEVYGIVTSVFQQIRTIAR